MNAHRITITVKDDLHKKLRNVQADMLRKSQNSISFSNVIDTVLRNGLK
jgi:predicted CopG family antitoxin